MISSGTGRDSVDIGGSKTYKGQLTQDGVLKTSSGIESSRGEMTGEDRYYQ